MSKPVDVRHAVEDGTDHYSGLPACIVEGLYQGD
jgi:hypothetical protein